MTELLKLRRSVPCVEIIINCDETFWSYSLRQQIVSLSVGTTSAIYRSKERFYRGSSVRAIPTGVSTICFLRSEEQI